MIKRYCLYLLFFIFLLKGNALQSQLEIELTADSQVIAGQPIDVDVSVADFNNLFGIQYAVAWDSLVLEIDSLLNISTSLPDFNRASLTLPSEMMTGTKGRLNVSWFSGESRSLPDDHLLFTMRFNQIGNECDETTFEITNPENLFIEIIDENLSEIGVTSNILPIQLPGSNCEGGGNDTDIQLIFNDQSVEAGTSVCIPLTVENFTDIGSFQGSIMWEPAVLSYNGLQNFALPGLSEALFNLNFTDNGMLSFSWFDNSTMNPVTIADGGNVFEICFDVIGNIGETSSLKVTDNPVMIELSSPSGSGVSVTDGNITVVRESTRDLFSIIADDVVVGSMQSEVCVDFSTRNFDEILGMQYIMQWDPNVLAYNRVETTDSQFGTSFVTDGNDKLLYSWTHSIGTGLSLQDGTIIYSVCFDIIADCDNTSENTISTPISFIGEPSLPIEISDNTLEALLDSEVDLVDGSVTITCDPGCIETITNVKCFGESNGAINLNIFGGSSPYTVDWQPGGPQMMDVMANTLLVGQSAGTFTAMITDDSGSTFNCGPYTISQPDELILTVNVGATVTTMTTGGNGGTTISYSDPNFDPNNPIPGTYTVTAIDSRDCTDSQTFTIPSIGSCDVEVSNVSIFSANCNMDGRIIVTCSGSGEYDILSTPQLNFDGNGEAFAPPGVYDIVCRDRSDVTCFATVTRTVLLGPPPALTAGVTGTTPATCNLMDGMISTMISDGCPPYTISVESNDSPGVIIAHNDSNLYAAGSYNVVFTDASGSNRFETTAVIGSTSGPDIEISNIDITPSPCNGLNGEATFTVTGGCGNSTCQVSINGGAPENCTLITNSNGTLTGSFPLGNHTIIFNDTETGTSATESFTIDSSINLINVSVVSSGLPAIDVNVSGGEPGYSFEWFFNGNIIALTEDLSGLTQPGIYTLFVEDSNGCTTSIEVVVVRVGELGINVDQVSTPFSGFATPCGDGECNGSITGFIQGDDAPFTVTLVDSGANSMDYLFEEAGNFTINDLCADSYEITLSDNIGQSVSGGVRSITAPDVLEISADPNDLVCPDDGMNNGSILASVTGGVGNYTLNWTPDELNDPFPTFLVEDLGPGIYTLAVTDDNDCESEFTFDLLTTCTDAECFQGRRVITPNNDGTNDVLTITCSENTEIAIFDRYSRLVFESSNYTNNWNGIDLDNIDLPQGAYYWVIRNSTSTYKGTVTLLRD